MIDSRIRAEDNIVIGLIIFVSWKPLRENSSGNGRAKIFANMPIGMTMSYFQSTEAMIRKAGDATQDDGKLDMSELREAQPGKSDME